MDNSLYFILSALFIAGMAVTCFVALRSESRLKLIVPLTLALSISVTYYTFDAYIGTAKSIDAIPGWTYPKMDDGVTVLGVDMAPNGVYLLLKEKGSAPKLYWFEPNEKFKQNLKKAMDNQAKRNKGNPMGFEMKRNGEAAEGKDGKGGKGGKGAKPKGNGTGRTGPEMDGSLEDRESPFIFPDPQPKKMPEKPYEADGYREYQP